MIDTYESLRAGVMAARHERSTPLPDEIFEFVTNQSKDGEFIKLRFTVQDLFAMYLRSYNVAKYRRGVNARESVSVVIFGKDALRACLIEEPDASFEWDMLYTYPTVPIISDWPNTGIVVFNGRTQDSQVVLIPSSIISEWQQSPALAQKAATN